jgi:16S rRNA (guanine966-N2)-methyltransferase
MNTLRITAGSLRGRRLAVPKGEIRPTSERARQAFFNIVGDRIVGARFLDLFAGTGAFAFEAVSRGAREAVALDLSRASVASIEANARALAVPVKALQSDALPGLKRLGAEAFDVIYADPPYAWEQYDALLTALDSSTLLADGGILAIEHRRRTEPFSITLTHLEHSRTAEYGEVWISFFICTRSHD